MSRLWWKWMCDGQREEIHTQKLWELCSELYLMRSDVVDGLVRDELTHTAPEAALVKSFEEMSSLWDYYQREWWGWLYERSALLWSSCVAVIHNIDSRYSGIFLTNITRGNTVLIKTLIYFTAVNWETLKGLCSQISFVLLLKFIWERSRLSFPNGQSVFKFLWMDVIKLCAGGYLKFFPVTLAAVIAIDAYGTPSASLISAPRWRLFYRLHSDAHVFHDICFSFLGNVSSFGCFTRMF